MNKLYFADDEARLRSGITHFIKRNFSNIEIVGEADNGLTAYEEIIAMQPDIVITDVKMPGMDGIELSKLLRSKLPDIKIIFISGYDDVAFIKMALQLEAIDYILKPIELEELERVLAKAVDFISEENIKRKKIIKMEKQLLQSMPVLRQRFFSMIIKSKNDGKQQFSKQELCRKMEFIGLDLPYEGNFIAIDLHVENIEKLPETENEKDWQLLSFAILNVFQETINNYTKGYAFETEFGEFAAILNYDNEEYEDSLLSFAGELSKNLKESLEIDIVLGIGKKVELISHIGLSWNIAHASTKKKIFLGNNHTVAMDTLFENEHFVLNEGVLEDLKEHLYQEDKESIFKCLSHLFEQIENENTESYRMLCSQMLFSAMRFLLETNVNPLEGKQNQLQVIRDIISVQTKKEMRSIVEWYYDKICETVEDSRSETRNTTKKVKDIIDKRYREKLTINSIANEIFLTPTYVCLVFKEDTGMTINEYLTRVRMNAAKKMLTETDIKFTKIAEQVGYADSSYFSKLFKKLEGVLPSEYRKNNG